MADLKLGTLVRFAHERDGGPVHRVVSVMRDGMIELHDMGGYFAPHLFAVADDIGDIPPDPPLSELVRLQAAVAYCRMRLKRDAYRDTLDAILRGDKDDQIRNPDMTPGGVVVTNIPLRCLCGNAVLRPRLEHEANAREVVTSLCPDCDTGGFEETFYTHPNGKLMTWPEWMESQGIEP